MLYDVFKIRGTELSCPVCSYNNTIGIRSDPKHSSLPCRVSAMSLTGDMIMLNLATSFVNTFLSVVLSFLSFLKGPVLLILGVIAVVIVLSSPAEAATIKCAMHDCPPLDGMIWERKLALLLLLIGGLITIFLIATEKGE